MVKPAYTKFYRHLWFFLTGLFSRRYPILCLVILLSCCKQKTPRDIEPSFYYWKSIFNIGRSEQHVLQALHVNRLYVKFFDIAWNESKSEPMPVAVIKFTQKPPPYSIIPTVFISNDCMQQMKDEQVSATAKKIVLLIKNITAVNEIITLPEIQMDCDWNGGTKIKYFNFLQIIKTLIARENILLSATVRLHQYKYYKKMGVPPVERGLLMCYNMGNLKDPASANSILAIKELKSYMKGFNEYPLPLDVALPVFSWKVLFRNKKYHGIIRELPTVLLKKDPAVKQSGNNYEFLQNTSINGYDFETGDWLRDEAVDIDELNKSAVIVSEKLKGQHLNIVLYHLDSLTLNKFSIHELETIFNHFR